MADIYRVLEVLQKKTVTWESQDYKSFREAQKVKQEKTKRNCNPDVVYKVKIFQPEGVTKGKTGVL